MFRTLSDRTTERGQENLSAVVPYFHLLVSVCGCVGGRGRTFIFPYVFQSKRETGILSFHDAHLAESTLADDSKKPEMIEVD